MSKVSEVESLVNDLSIPSPDADSSDVFWFKPDRGSPNYFRLVPSEDGYEDYYYDVWVEADLSIDKAGVYSFTMEVVIYNGRLEHRMDDEDIANLSFEMDEGSRIQTIINNWETAYRKNAKETVEEYADWAENQLLDDLEEE